jgi:fission process protein 1
MPLYLESDIGVLAPRSHKYRASLDDSEDDDQRLDRHDELGEVILESVEEIEQIMIDEVVHPLRDGIMRFSPYMRYLAYSSDIGESFRRVAHVRFVHASYAVAISYVVGDVALNGYYEHHFGSPPATVAKTMAHSGLFQLCASLLFPFLAIHSGVKVSKTYLFKPLTHSERWIARHGKGGGAPSAFVRQWGPSAVGLGIIPFLPLVDEPIEGVVDWIFGGHITPHKRGGDDGSWASYLDAVYPSWWRD